MENQLEILCTAYKRPKLLATQLWSLAAQTRRDFSIKIIHDGGQDSAVIKIVEDFRLSNPDMEVDLLFSGIRYNDWGHSLREIGLMASKARFMLITNDDNYYAPSFVERMMAPLEDGYDISYCNMVHSHTWPIRYGLLKMKEKRMDYQPLYCRPELGSIDIGAFMFRTELGQLVGFKDRSFEADGVFFELLLTQTSRIQKIDGFLFVHN